MNHSIEDSIQSKFKRNYKNQLKTFKNNKNSYEI
jgi:hypothetical protein